MNRLPVKDLSEFDQRRILSLADREQKFESVIKLLTMADAKATETLKHHAIDEEFYRSQGVCQLIEEFFEFINKEDVNHEVY